MMLAYHHVFRRLGFASCDGSFGPFASCADGRFDFTFLFEQSILSIIPSAVLLLITPLRVWQLAGRKPKVSASFAIYLKLVCVPLHSEDHSEKYCNANIHPRPFV